VDPATAITSAWASGLSVYAVAAFLGIAGRLDWVDSPSWLQEPWAIAVAVALLAVELVVDKIPAVDSVWDAIHTGIRPAAGAVLLSGADADLGTFALAAAGGLLALSSHSAKASVRVLVNTSPEPVSNVVVSTGEDGLVALLMTLAIANPEVALVLTILLFVASIVVTIVVFKTVRGAWRRLSSRRRQPTSTPGGGAHRDPPEG
jgi:hypothetical protein